MVETVVSMVIFDAREVEIPLATEVRTGGGEV
jgi:hypothetical protein